MKRHVLVGWLFSIYLVCAITACAGGTPEATLKPLRVEWGYREGDYTLLIAERMGYFDDHGVEVEPVLYDTMVPARADIGAAEIDGGIFPIGDVLLTSSQIPLKAVMVCDSGGVSSVVSAPGISSISNLRNKRIGINQHTSSEMFVTFMLETGGLNARSVTFVEMDPADVPQNIPTVIDAGYVIEPYTSQALQQGDTLLYSSSKYSTLIPTLIVFRQDVVEKRPNDIRAFIQAWNEAVAYRLNNPQEAMNIIVQATGLSESELGITGGASFYTIDDNSKLFAENPGSDASSIYYIANRNLNFLIEIGDITTPPDLNTLLDPSFLGD